MSAGDNCSMLSSHDCELHMVDWSKFVFDKRPSDEVVSGPHNGWKDIISRVQYQHGFCSTSQVSFPKFGSSGRSFGLVFCCLLSVDPPQCPHTEVIMS